MVLSYYLYKCPYKILWYINSFFKEGEVFFYCADPLDYEMFEPINKYLQNVIIVAKNSKSRKYLKNKGISFKRMPVFPRAVIMARHEHYKFPVDKIIKIGFDHGLYQFKRWTSPKNYNSFDIYFVSSNEQVKTAQKMNIRTTIAIGYPKLDNAFNGQFDNNYLDKLKRKMNLNPEKKTIIFTSTWDVSGLSALHKWIDHVVTLTEQFNILLTVHTWTSPKYIKKLKSIDGAVYLDEYDVTPYLMIADVFIGDYNSLIGEFCAFDKPIITFKVPESNRSIPEVHNLIKSISIQIENFDELNYAIKRCLNNPGEKAEERKKANKILFDNLDGLAGKRAADEITNYINSSIN